MATEASRPSSMDRPTPVRDWKLEDVLQHLEYAVNLELWTIPYYMTVMYSIKEPSDPVFRTLQSVVYQEMLHAQLAANVYNAFPSSRRLRIGPFLYTKEGGVPHLDFRLDPEAVKRFGGPDARLGGLDLTRVGTMCLIELPEDHPADLSPKYDSYATIGDFYDAVRCGMRQRAGDLRGGQKQVDFLGRFYGQLPGTTVTADRVEGLRQALDLIEIITEQGEGLRQGDLIVPARFQNTADGYDESRSHFAKMESIRNSLLLGRAPATYIADPHKHNTRWQRTLAETFTQLIQCIEAIFNGEVADGFGEVMPKVGSAIHTCWRNQVVPQFSIQE